MFRQAIAFDRQSFKCIKKSLYSLSTIQTSYRGPINIVAACSKLFKTWSVGKVNTFNEGPMINLVKIQHTDDANKTLMQRAVITFGSFRLRDGLGRATGNVYKETT